MYNNIVNSDHQRRTYLIVDIFIAYPRFVPYYNIIIVIARVQVSRIPRGAPRVLQLVMESQCSNGLFRILTIANPIQRSMYRYECGTAVTFTCARRNKYDVREIQDGFLSSSFLMYGDR